jgi:hypothetical protein
VIDQIAFLALGGRLFLFLQMILSRQIYHCVHAQKRANMGSALLPFLHRPTTEIADPRLIFVVEST